MKAITILEPWASLIAFGHKRIETRSWKTAYRGKIAIHAGAKHTRLQFNDPYYSALRENYNLHVPYTDDELPYGKIIAIADLVDVKEITANIFDTNTKSFHGAIIGSIEKNDSIQKVMGEEYLFGDYSIGRYAWILENIVRVKPISIRGNQRIWNISDELSQNLLK